MTLERRPLVIFLSLLVGVMSLMSVAPAMAHHRVISWLSTGPSHPNDTGDAAFCAASPNGERVVFDTLARLSAEDTDIQTRDVYVKLGEKLIVASTGPNDADVDGANANCKALSPDGKIVYFTTTAKLVAQDADPTGDLYAYNIETEETRLISTGPAEDPGQQSAVQFDAVSQDGSKVFFTTSMFLTSTDIDQVADVYSFSWVTKTVTHLSYGGPSDITIEPAEFGGASANGNIVAFTTAARLVPALDADLNDDVYVKDGSTTELVSTGSINANEAKDARFEGINPSGTNVYFGIASKLEVNDADNARDVYRRSIAANQSTLFSTGPEDKDDNVEIDVVGQAGAGYLILSTMARLTDSDTDGLATDLYFAQLFQGQVLITQMSTGPSDTQAGNIGAKYVGHSGDTSRFYFETSAKLTPDDLDTAADVYGYRVGGSVSLVSAGTAGVPQAAPASFGGASYNGSRVYFETADPLTSADKDAATDVYVRQGAATTLVSDETVGTQPTSFASAGETVDLVLFGTGSSLVGGDADNGGIDLYSSRAAACSDGLDNDGDAKIDFPGDPGCAAAGDDSEVNTVPPVLPQCADGVDNDADGKKDFPADRGCASGSDQSESPDPAVIDRRPSSTIKRLKRSYIKGRLRAIRGSATDDVGVKAVRLSIVRKAGRKCFAMTAKQRWKQYRKSGKNCKPKFLVKAKGTAKWSVRLRRALRTGGYEIRSRAMDSSGQIEKKVSKRNRKLVKVRR